MASAPTALSASSPASAAGGLSGQSVRGAVDAVTAVPAAPAVSAAPAASALPAASAMPPPGLENAVPPVGEALLHGADQAAHMAGQGMAQAAQDGGQAASQIANQAAHAGFSWGSYTQAVGVLFLLLALLWLAVWLVRRYGRFNFLPRPGALPRDALVMEAQLPLGPRKGLMVVRFLNRRLLLGVTDQHITLLTEEQAHHEPQDVDFQRIMEQARRNAGDGPSLHPPA